MMLDPRLEAWIATATYWLAPVSEEQVRAEIAGHYESACDAGQTPEGAIKSLGDPRRANREYRRVLLTEFEAIWAPRAVLPAKPQRLHWSRDLLLRALVSVAFIVWARVYTSPDWRLWLWSSANMVGLARDCFPRELVRRYLGGAVGVLWWAGLVLPGLPVLFAVLAGWTVVFLFAQRIRRKLAGQPPLVPDPARDQVSAGSALTSAESILLRMLQRESKCVAWSSSHLLLSLLVAEFVGGFLLFIHAVHPGKHPAEARYLGVLLITFAAASFVRVLSFRASFLQTPERGPRFRRVKWTILAIAVLAPPSTSWMLGRDFPGFDGVVTAITAVYYVMLFVASFSEYIRLSLRRKLPESQWPKGLYS